MSWKQATLLFVVVAIVAALAAWGTALVVLSIRDARSNNRPATATTPSSAPIMSAIPGTMEQ